MAETISRNPCGLHIQRIKAPNDDWVIAHCRNAGYITTTVLEGNRLAGRLQAEAGVLYSVARVYGFEPYPGEAASDAQIKAYAIARYQDVKNVARDAQNSNIHVMVNCEQGVDSRRLKMYVEMMHAAVADPEPVGMVFCNNGSGTIKSGFWDEPNDWLRPEFMEYLRTLHKYRHVRLKSGAYAFLHGSHPYTGLYPWVAMNAGAHRIPDWATYDKWKNGLLKIDWSKAQDHLGREYQGIRLALGYRWDNTARKWLSDHALRDDNGLIEPPWMINTEGWFDDMADVRGVHGQVIVDGSNVWPKGYRSIKTQWEQHWFKGCPVGKTHALFDQLIWEVVYEPEGYWVGSHLFCMGDTGGWNMDNVTPEGTPDKDYIDQATPYRRALPAHFAKAGATAPPETPPPASVRPIKLDSPARVEVAGLTTILNLRRGPGTVFEDIGDIKNGNQVTAFQGTMVLDRGTWWIYIKGPEQYGWIAMIEGLQLRLLGEAPPRESAPETDPPTPDPKYAGAIALLQKALLGVGDSVSILQAVIDDIQSF